MDNVRTFSVLKLNILEIEHYESEGYFSRFAAQRVLSADGPGRQFLSGFFEHPQVKRHRITISDFATSQLERLLRHAY